MDNRIDVIRTQVIFFILLNTQLSSLTLSSGYTAYRHFTRWCWGWLGL